MTKQRTLGDALTLSPEKMAFIAGEQVATAGKASRPSETLVKTIEVGMPTPGEVAQSSETPSRPATRRLRQRDLTTTPNADEVLGDLLVPLTTRLPHRMVQTLRRLCLEQRLMHTKPDNIQDIVEVALEGWLAKRQ